MAYDRSERRPNKKGRRKVCAFCVDKVENIDYKEAKLIIEKERLESKNLLKGALERGCFE